MCDQEQRRFDSFSTVHAMAPWLRQVENYMWAIVGIVIVLIAVVVIPYLRMQGGVNASRLGWMSEKWLAQYRASSHSP